MARRDVDSDDGEGGDALLVALGRRVREAREGTGRSLATLASAADISKDYLWRVETGRQALTVKTLATLARALGTTMSELMADVEREAVGSTSAASRSRANRDPSDPATARPPIRPTRQRRQDAD